VGLDDEKNENQPSFIERMNGKELLWAFEDWNCRCSPSFSRKVGLGKKMCSLKAQGKPFKDRIW